MSPSTNAQSRLAKVAEAFKLEELEHRLEFEDPVSDVGGDPTTDGFEIIIWSRPLG